MADERNNEIEETKLPGAIDAIRTLDMRGSNVSMPNKKKVIPYLDKLDKTSQMCDAVNTIVNEHGVLTGYTTDGMGWLRVLKKDGQGFAGRSWRTANPGYFQNQERRRRPGTW